MAKINITQVLQMGLGAHHRGNKTEAERLYRQILSADPTQPDALHLLGVLLHQTGRSAEGIEMIRRAITRGPRTPMYHGNLANILRETGQFALAAEQARIACELDPNNIRLLLNLGNLYNNELHRYAEAAPIFKKILALDARMAPALFGLALALHRLGDIAGAFPYYEQARAISPRDVDLLSNFAGALLADRQTARALEMYENAIALDPGKSFLWYNLGVARMAEQSNEPALAAFRKAIELNPADIFAHTNVAAILRAQGKLETAAKIYTDLLRDHPLIAQLHSNLGLTRLSQGRQEEGIAAVRRAVALDPASPAIYENLLFSMHYDPSYDAQRLYAEHRAWAELIESKITPEISTRDRALDRRLRIGYVSPDFRQHSVQYFIEPILAGHNHRATEIFCYSTLPDSDDVTRRLRSLSDHWRNIDQLSDEAAAHLIRQDGIDILLDLALHTQGSRLPLLARQPAPLQGAWLGYASTTGLRAIDFRLTDKWIDPPGVNEAYHSEKLARLPDTQWVYRPPANVPPVGPLPALQAGRITFGAATNLAKISGSTLAMWAEVLRSVPQSLLIIKGLGIDDPPTRQYFLDQFRHAGVGESQLRFEPSAPLAEYFQFFSRIDLILDTFPFAGGTTSCHALYMGVPMITLIGDTSVSRVGSSLLHNVGLPELIADSGEGFVRIGAELAQDQGRLSEIRRNLRAMMQASPLMDEPRFVKNLEAAYGALWEEYCHEQGKRM